MALIEGFRIQNYRALKDIAMGRIGTDPEYKKVKPLTPLTTVIGKNGAGKSSIFDALGFLADCMESDLETACNAKGRGGYDKLLTNGNENEALEGDESQKRKVEFDPHRLAIVSLAEQFSENPRIAKFKNFIKSWYLSYFYPDAARQIPQAGVQKHLNLHGDNVGNVVQYLERNHPIILKRILKDISSKIPGIGTIETYKDPITNNLYLLFKDKGFAKPFTQQQMSDGTLKMFCYMLLLQDPDPPPFICIEEPENGLYHKLLETLASEFRSHATGRKGGSQVFITTHQPYFVDALEPDEVWVLEKGVDGISTIRRASEYNYISDMANEGQPLGGLWYSDYLDAR